MTPLERITERVNRNGDVNELSTPRPLLTLAEFFDGNDVIGSIGCNLIPPVPPHEFFLALVGIAAREDVGEIRVQVVDFDSPDWPFTDTVWIITSASAKEVLSWFDESMRPDECVIGWPLDTPMEPCFVPIDMHPVCCFWD